MVISPVPVIAPPVTSKPDSASKWAVISTCPLVLICILFSPLVTSLILKTPFSLFIWKVALPLLLSIKSSLGKLLVMLKSVVKLVELEGKLVKLEPSP